MASFKKIKIKKLKLKIKKFKLNTIFSSESSKKQISA
jgi:hypothetical protein